MFSVDWVMKNKEWLFGGIGVTLIYYLIRFLFKLFSKFWKKQEDNTHSENILEQAIFNYRNITSSNLCYTGLRKDNNFKEYCLNDFSDTWLTMIINKLKLTDEIKNQLKIVNRHIDNTESRHNKVKILFYINKKPNNAKLNKLKMELDGFARKENLSKKITFEVWTSYYSDKNNFLSK